MPRIFSAIIFLCISISASTQHPCFSRLKNYSVPQYFETGSMGGFYTLNEISLQLDSMQLQFPNLINAKADIDTFHSIEGRPMYWVEITNLLDSANHKPQVLFTSLHHAMEPMGMQQLIFFMDYLLENYGTDPEITYLINNLEIYFVPAVNPDGYEYNYTNNPTGGGTWRKNMRNNGLTTGVDLNRNYGVAFGYDEIGSSSLGWHPWYRGDSAFSEPETKAIRYFQMHHDFRSAINWHSYGNYIIYPWNYSAKYTTDSLTFEAFSKMMAFESNYVYGTCYETYGYQSNGDADDWAYTDTLGKHNILSLTAESGSSSDGFWPTTTSKIIELCKEALPNNLTFLRLNLHYAKIHDLSSSVIDNSSGYLQYKIQNLGLDTPSTFTVQFTSLTPGLVINNTAKHYNALHKLQEVYDSINYNISFSGNSELKYIVTVDNGSYIYSDTVVKYFAPTSLYFSDDCSVMTYFSGNDWGVATNQYYSSPSSITESPGGNYSSLQSSELTVDSVIDLTNAEYATVNFYAKWNLENNYDYVQMLVSTDNGSTWTSLCGKYSEIASSDEPTGEPVWDAIQKDWILEDVPLTDYLGMPAKIKFSFYADQSNTRDGFYFDDLKIYVVQSLTTQSNAFVLNSEISIKPNPVHDFIYINSENKEFLSVKITDIFGNTVHQTRIFSAGIMNLKDMPAGIYVVTVSGKNSVFQKKLVKI
jgi:carboxypeptidase T